MPPTYNQLLILWARDSEAIRKWQKEHKGQPITNPSLQYLQNWANNQEAQMIEQKLNALSETIAEAKTLNATESAGQAVTDAVLEKYAPKRAHGSAERPSVTDLPEAEPMGTATPYYPVERFTELFSKSCRQIAELYAAKGAEYRGSNDVLANFRRGAAKMNLPLLTVWDGLAHKHFDSIEQFIQDDRNGVKRERTEGIARKVDDAIVYLFILKAMLDERGEL